MARYIDADELIRLLGIDAVCEGDYFSKRSAIKSVKTINTADVVPRAELEELITLNSQLEATIFGQREEIKKLEIALSRSLPSYCQVFSEEQAMKIGYGKGKSEVARDILSDLKKEIHDKAVYPEARSVKPYISLKVVDAIINNKMEEIKNEREN